MTDSLFPITPPVPAEILSALRAELPEAPTITAPVAIEEPLSLLQRLVRLEGSAAVSAVAHVAILLVAALGLHLSATDVATLGSIVSVALAYFVSINFRARSASKR